MRRSAYYLLGFALFLHLPFTPVAFAQNEARITVGGDAVVQVKPDKVVFVFGIETWDRDIADSMALGKTSIKAGVSVIFELLE
jgi:uncharacterized protein YggE